MLFLVFRESISILCSNDSPFPLLVPSGNAPTLKPQNLKKNISSGFWNGAAESRWCFLFIIFVILTPCQIWLCDYVMCLDWVETTSFTTWLYLSPFFKEMFDDSVGSSNIDFHTLRKWRQAKIGCWCMVAGCSGTHPRGILCTIYLIHPYSVPISHISIYVTGASHFA